MPYGIRNMACPLSKMEYQPDSISVSAVAIEFDPLKIEFARRQPQMPPLMRLISVQPASGLPLTFHIFSFLSRKDADERRAWRVGLESDDQTCPGKDKLV